MQFSLHKTCGVSSARKYLHLNAAAYGHIQGAGVPVKVQIETTAKAMCVTSLDIKGLDPI